MRSAKLEYLDAVRPEASSRSWWTWCVLSLVTDLCLVNLALSDKPRAWSGQLPEEQARTRTIPLDQSTCPDVVQTEEPLVVEDFRTDDRFSGHKLHTVQGIRFYAGTPLVTSDGVTIGTLCVLDAQPREFGEERLTLLEAFARAVVQRLEMLGARGREQTAKERELQRTLDVSPDIIATLGPDGIFASMNPASRATLEYEPEELVGESYLGLVHPDDRDAVARWLAEVVESDTASRFEGRRLRKDGGIAWIEASAVFAGRRAWSTAWPATSPSARRRSPGKRARRRLGPN